MTVRTALAPGRPAAGRRRQSPCRGSPPKCCWRTPCDCERVLAVRASRARAARSGMAALRPLPARAHEGQADAVHHRPPGILRPRVPRHAGRADPAPGNRARGGDRAAAGAGGAGAHCWTSEPARAPGRHAARSKPARPVWATDISPAALAVAAANAAAARRARLVRGLRPDVGVRRAVDGPDRLQSALRPAGPARGLAARSARLGAARWRSSPARPASKSTTAWWPMPRVLRPGGWLVMELGFGTWQQGRGDAFARWQNRNSCRTWRASRA